jgi:hypothetical protein
MRKLMLFFIGLLASNIYSQDDFNKYLEWRNQAKKVYDTEINILIPQINNMKYGIFRR